MGRAEGGRWNCTALPDAITQEGEIGRTPGGKGSSRGMALLWLDAGKHRKSYDLLGDTPWSDDARNGGFSFRKIVRV